MPFPILGVLGAVGGAMAGAGSIASAARQQPRPRIHQSVRDAMRAYWYMPSAISYEEAARPALSSIGMRGVEGIMFGSPGYTATAYTPEGRPQSFNVGPTPGLLPMTEEAYGSLWGTYAPYYESTIAATTDPAQAGFLRNLRDTAASELALGGSLSPSVRREISEQSLPGILNRYGPGASGAAMSLMERGREAERRLSDRIRQAAGIADVYQGLAPEYTLQRSLLDLSRNMQINPQALLQLAMTQQAGTGLQVANPYSIWGTGGAVPFQPNFSTANALGATAGGLFDMAGRFGGSYLNSQNNQNALVPAVSPQYAAYNPWSYGGSWTGPGARNAAQQRNYAAAQSWFE